VNRFVSGTNGSPEGPGEELTPGMSRLAHGRSAPAPDPFATEQSTRRALQAAISTREPDAGALLRIERSLGPLMAARAFHERRRRIGQGIAVGLACYAALLAGSLRMGFSLHEALQTAADRPPPVRIVRQSMGYPTSAARQVARPGVIPQPGSAAPRSESTGARKTGAAGGDR
jgi:hypothetical protein